MTTRRLGAAAWEDPGRPAPCCVAYPVAAGEDEQEQLLCIMEVMGAPPRRLADAAPRRKAFFEADGAPRAKPNSRGARAGQGWGLGASARPWAQASLQWRACWCSQPISACASGRPAPHAVAVPASARL